MTKLKKEGRNVCVCVGGAEMCVLVGCVCWWGTLLSFYLQLQLSTLDQEQKDPMKIITPDYALLQQPLSISLSYQSFPI